jgi:hypothetical protein
MIIKLSAVPAHAGWMGVFVPGVGLPAEMA